MPAPISVVNGEYSINGGPWTSAPGTINNNDAVRVRHTSAPAGGTDNNTILDVGGVRDTFTTTTEGSAVPNTPPSGTLQGTNAQGLNGANTELTCDASDPDGTVDFYEFYRNGTRFSFGTEPTAEDIPDDDATTEYLCVVTDNQGAQTQTNSFFATRYEEPPTINQPPQVALSGSPLEANNGQTILLEVDITDPDSSGWWIYVWKSRTPMPEKSPFPNASNPDMELIYNTDGYNDPAHVEVTDTPYDDDDTYYRAYTWDAEHSAVGQETASNEVIARRGEADNTAPVVQLTADRYIAEEGESINFTAVSFDVDGGPIEYSFDGGAFQASNLYTRNFPDEGTYIVTVVARDPSGATDYAEASVVILPGVNQEVYETTVGAIAGAAVVAAASDEQPPVAESVIGQVAGTGVASGVTASPDAECITEGIQYLRVEDNTPSGLTETKEWRTGTGSRSTSTRINFNSGDVGSYLDPETTIVADASVPNAPGTMFGRGWMQPEPAMEGEHTQAAGNFEFTLMTDITGLLTSFAGYATVVLNQVDADGNFKKEMGRGNSYFAVGGPNIDTDVVVVLSATETFFAEGDRKYIEIYISDVLNEGDTVRLLTGNASRMTSSPQICPVTGSLGTIQGIATVIGASQTVPPVNPAESVLGLIQGTGAATGTTSDNAPTYHLSVGTSGVTEGDDQVNFSVGTSEDTTLDQLSVGDTDG